MALQIICILYRDRVILIFWVTRIAAQDIGGLCAVRNFCKRSGYVFYIGLPYMITCFCMYGNDVLKCCLLLVFFVLHTKHPRVSMHGCLVFITVDLNALKLFQPFFFLFAPVYLLTGAFRIIIYYAALCKWNNIQAQRVCFHYRTDRQRP